MVINNDEVENSAEIALEPLTGRRRLYLMRHGHVDYFAPDLTDPRGVALTQKGIEQATAVKEALSKIEFDFACCSGLLRTRQTAKIVLSGQKLALNLHEDLRFEELKSGWIKAESREELAARLAFCFDQADQPSARFMSDGEIFGEAQIRIIAGLMDILTKKSWKSGLLVAHEGVNRILLSWVLSGGLSCVNALEQDLCGVNVIDFDVVPGGIDTHNSVKIERAVLKLMNITPYDIVKKGLPRTSLEHLFEVDFGASRPARS